MTAGTVVNVHQAQPFYITIATFSIDDVYLPKDQKVSKATNACEEIVSMKDERFSYQLA